MAGLLEILRAEATKKQQYDDDFTQFVKIGEKLGLVCTFMLPVDQGNSGPFVNPRDSDRKQDRDEIVEKFRDGAVHLLVSSRKHATIPPPGVRGKSGTLIRSTESALALEQERIQRCKEFMFREIKWGRPPSATGNEGTLKTMIENKIRQSTGTNKLYIKHQATGLIDILNKSTCPRHISYSLFAKQILAVSEKRISWHSGFASACAQVIIQVTSQVPRTMDFILAELQGLCMYTVPKHIDYSELAFESDEAYYRTIGFRVENGKIESRDRYKERLANYMTLYGALVQTKESGGFENSHGIMHGWAWLTRFLTGLPANEYTAVALEAFLRTAGFCLHKQYKFQFTRLLSDVSRKFLDGLKEEEEDQRLAKALKRIQQYIEGEEFLQEPEGLRKLQPKPPQLGVF